MRINPTEMATVSSTALDPRMTGAVDGFDGAGSSTSVEGTSSATEAGGIAFGDLLKGVVNQANQMDHNAAVKVDALARGTSDDLHGTMIATKEADISVHLVGTIRNKLLDAFQEIWRTSV
jgi:flagellar hook-basal body complex protein FliE